MLDPKNAHSLYCWNTGTVILIEILLGGMDVCPGIMYIEALKWVKIAL
jgi:hypothetical protein